MVVSHDIKSTTRHEAIRIEEALRLRQSRSYNFGASSMMAKKACTVTPIQGTKAAAGVDVDMDDSSTFNIDSQARDAESPDFFRLDNRQGN